MYVICPTCGRIFLKELYELGDDKAKCNTCSTIFTASNRQVDLTNPKSYKNAKIKTSCKHIDVDGFPTIIPSEGSYMCRICHAIISASEYHNILSKLEYDLREQGVTITQ